MSSEQPAAAGRRRVLIIEDDTLVGLGVRNALERLGHEVIGQVSTTDDALALFESSKPDFVLVDVRLENSAVDGIALAEKLLARRRVPMIVISAYSERGLIERATDVGVYGYLIKPISAQSLAAQMEGAHRRVGRPRQLGPAHPQPHP